MEREAPAWLLDFLMPHRRRLITILILTIIGAGFGLAQPYIICLLIDDGLLQNRYDLVVQLCLLMAVFGLASVLVGIFNRRYSVATAIDLMQNIRARVFSHLTHLPPLFYARAKRGELAARLHDDFGELERFSLDTIMVSVNAFFVLVGGMILMLSLSWQLSLIALLLITVQFLVLRLLRPRIEQLARRLRERNGGIRNFLFETLSAMRFIQSVAAEKREIKHLRNLQEHWSADSLQMQMANYSAVAMPTFMTSLNTALVFMGGSYLVMQNSLSIGALIAFSAYLVLANGPLKTLLGFNTAAQRAAASWQRLMDIVTINPAISTSENGHRIQQTARGSISFRQVSFTYREDSPNVLNNVDVVLPAGKKTVIGSITYDARNALLDLLQRYCDPGRGSILFDDTDLRELNVMDLRRSIAVVAQDAVLFSGNILENIRYVAPAADDESIAKAIKLARVDEFASQLPQGFKTLVGMRGIALSGEHRQRIALARALIQNPVVIIFDETFSGAAQNAGNDLIGVIDRVFAQRTRLVISPQKKTLQAADIVLELVAGYLLPPDMARNEKETMH